MQLNYNRNKSAIAEQQEKAKERKREDSSPKTGNDALNQRSPSSIPKKGEKRRFEEGNSQESQFCWDFQNKNIIHVHNWIGRISALICR